MDERAFVIVINGSRGKKHNDEQIQRFRNFFCDVLPF